MEIRLHLPFALAWEEIAAKLRLDEDDGEDLRPYFEEAMRIANPKAAFCRVAVRVEDEKHVWLGDTRFESALMARNLAACKEVYPYVATSGRELYDLCQSVDAPLCAIGWNSLLRACCAAPWFPCLRKCARCIAPRRATP